MNKVKEQFERAKRWHKRFQEISTGRSHTRESDYYQDVLYAFFQNCWHLRDWTINSGTLDKETVDNFFHSDNTDMKICRDIANGSKHLTINDPSIDSGISVARRQFSLSLGGGPPKINVVYWIRAENHPPIDAFALATTCLAHCEGFLRLHNLLDESEGDLTPATTQVNINGAACIIKP